MQNFPVAVLPAPYPFAIYSYRPRPRIIWTLPNMQYYFPNIDQCTYLLHLR